MWLVWVTRVLGALFCLFASFFALGTAGNAINQSAQVAQHTLVLIGYAVGTAWPGWLVGVAVVFFGEMLRLLASIRDAINHNAPASGSRP